MESPVDRDVWLEPGILISSVPTQDFRCNPTGSAQKLVDHCQPNPTCDLNNIEANYTQFWSKTHSPYYIRLAGAGILACLYCCLELKCDVRVFEFVVPVILSIEIYQSEDPDAIVG